MNIEPTIKVVFGFKTLKDQSELNASVIWDKYKLNCLGYRGWIEQGWFLSEYSLQGLPKYIIKFLKSEEVLNKLI